VGASLALAGVNGCSVRPAPSFEVVPFVRAPEELIPVKPLFYATAITMAGRGVDLLVESHLGRPTKIEGNPDHPASLGATDRLRVLRETIVSPTLAWQIDELLKELPEAKWHQYEPLAPDHAHQAAIQAFGEPTNTYYDFARADVILSLDAPFLDCGPASLRYTHDFADRRRVRTTGANAGQAQMNRLYLIEPGLSCTGAKADHRLAVPGARVEELARAIAAALLIQVAAGRRRSTMPGCRASRTI
jgi:molybdopterin-containing oxidoreductase family iron-sulfur binding subunit